MSRRSRKGNRVNKPFLVISHQFLRSESFKTLTPAARLICLEIYMVASAQTRDGPVRGGMRAQCSYSQIRKHTWFSGDTVARAIKQLVAAGFIKKLNDRQLREGSIDDTCGEYEVSEEWKR